MSRPNRRDIVDPDEIGVYHCYSRCVQRAFLCGYDPLTEKDYSHRKEWVEERQELLVSVFAMELLGHAILDNHMHHVIRTRPDVAREWTDEEVVRRWWTIHPWKNENGEVLELTEERLEGLLQDVSRVAEWRRRLASLSWFMKELKEEIAKRANRESGMTGHFFEARFSSPRLADAVTLLLCLLYVDLNAVRAGVADTPEASRHTSFWKRVQGRRCRVERGGRPADPERPDPDAALKPIFEGGEPGNAAAPQFRLSDRGFLPLTADEYFELVDWSGRQSRRGNQNAIPDDLPPILDRLADGRDFWLAANQNYERGWQRAGRQVQVKPSEKDDAAS